MKSWLIQRATAYKVNEIISSDKKGIDTVFKWDYMGSAEFEFGALGQSLKRIKENIDTYCIIEVYKTINGFSSISFL
jgi:hypothetical protein